MTIDLQEFAALTPIDQKDQQSMLRMPPGIDWSIDSCKAWTIVHDCFAVHMDETLERIDLKAPRIRRGWGV